MRMIHRTWGTTPEERELDFYCDQFMEIDDDAVFRGVTINASKETVFRWLCQMRVAPYSYDWIDNFGRKSPRQLTPGLENLEIGQTFMTIFDLLDFKPGSDLTLRIKPNSRALKLFGDVLVTYRIIPNGNTGCRLLAKLVIKYPEGIWGRLLKQFLIFGDFIMMRRQLLNFKKLAEGTVSPEERSWDRINRAAVE